MTASIKPGYKLTEVGVIPKKWVVRQVSEMGEVRAGKALAAKGPGTLRPYLRTKNVYDGRIDINDVLEMPMTDSEFSLNRLRDGDILLNEGQSIELVGRCSMYQDEYLGPCAIQNQLVRFRAYDGTSAAFATHVFRRCQRSGVFSKIALQTTSVAHLGVSRFARLKLAWPSTLTEQEAIANALSDADGLIESLEQLVAKKRRIKRGAMQELLTGQKRLPGFTGDWEVKRLGEIAEIVMGQSPSSLNYNRSGVGLPLIQGNADIDRRETIQRIYTTQVTKRGWKGDLLMSVRAPVGEISRASFDVCLGRGVCAIRYPGQFLYQYLIWLEPTWAKHSKGSTFDSVNSAEVKALEITLPNSAEQSAIAAILSDMDAEIVGLEAKLAKARRVKQGMMQELLTGRIRLIQPAKTEASPKGHNWAFNEAVVISVLAKSFGSEQYPLGRKRYTKLSYLMHRHHEHRVEGYLKKAAGPYNPATKYKGPEVIAIKSGYMREHNNGKYTAFVAGPDITKAEGYFRNWYGDDVLNWLEQFRFKSNDDLELLATVDMAVEDLRREGTAVNLAAVKAVIGNHPEWEAKLGRETFSDLNIARAIKQCGELFGTGG